MLARRYFGGKLGIWFLVVASAVFYGYWSVKYLALLMGQILLNYLFARRLERAPSTPQALAFRARLILRCAHTQPPTNEQVAAELGCEPDTVSKWRRRFQRHRVDGLCDRPRSGRPATFSP